MTTMEIIKVTMAMEEDTYYEIVMLLEELDIMGDYVYTTEDVAEIVGVALEVVEYIDRIEHDDWLTVIVFYLKNI